MCGLLHHDKNIEIHPLYLLVAMEIIKCCLFISIAKRHFALEMKYEHYLLLDLYVHSNQLHVCNSSFASTCLQCKSRELCISLVPAVLKSD